MYELSELKDIKKIDPVWKRLRVERIWKIVFLAYLLFYFIFNIGNFWRMWGGLTIFELVFLSAGIVVAVINQMRWERYWKHIGERRMEALRDPQPFIAGSQPMASANALSLPITVRLQWSRFMLVVAATLVIITFGVMLAAILLVLIQRGRILDALSIVGVLALMIAVIGLLVYFLFLRYQPQEIELTEEGLRTRYMGQERMLRWEEARVFAMYDAQGIKKSAFAGTYELSNERTVVRWGHQMFMNPFLVVQSSVRKREDFHWLVEQINALVTAHSGLPLLDFSERSSPQVSAFQIPATVHSVPMQEQVEEVPEQEPVIIARHDPLLERVKLRGGTISAIVAVCVLCFLPLVTALIGKLTGGAGVASSLSSGRFSNFLLFFGVLMLVLLLFLLPILRVVSRYWNRIARVRVEAMRQPERFRSQVQPTRCMELPQAASVRIQGRRSVMLPLMFVEAFVLWFVFFAFLFGLGGSHLFVALGTSVLFGLVMGLFLSSVIRQAQEQRIEVTPYGISSRYGGVSSQMRWRDARLFSCYRGPRLFKKNSRSQIYELASEETVVRWIWPHSRMMTFTGENNMSQQEFDVWMEQVNGYVENRTGLELMELD